MSLKSKVVNKIYSISPGYIQDKIDYWRFKRLVNSGLSLIDEDVIKEKYKQAIEIILNDPQIDQFGDYLEFGVFYGSSITCMYECLQEMKIEEVRLFGFDSFEGLPDEADTDDDGSWNAGQFNANYEFAKDYIYSKISDRDRVNLIKGWYKDTLNDKTISKYNIKKVNIIMIDCDMYKSSKLALNFCSGLIKDSAVIFFDDWNSMNLAERGLGEKKAYEEFMESNPNFSGECIGEYSYQGDMNGKIFKIVNAGC